MNLETKILHKKPCFLDNFSQETRKKKFSAQLEDHMNIEKILRVIGRHFLEAIFCKMRVAVIYPPRQKEL